MQPEINITMEYMECEIEHDWAAYMAYNEPYIGP